MTEIRDRAPAVLFNGWNDQNMHLLELRGQEYFEQEHQFPRERFLIATEQNKVVNTKDQLADILPEYFIGNRKIVIVSDGYHLPRIRRYLQLEGSPIDPNKTILYPSQPLYMPGNLVDSEIRKIWLYSSQEDMPRFV